MPKVAIVILNWNGKHFLESFLSLLIERTPEPWTRIYVADNGSKDGSVSWLREKFPGIHLILFDRNLGYTGGYNKALEQIDAQYYILLNSDVEVTPGWLLPLIEYMDTHTGCGVCMPRILSWTNPAQFEYAGACGGFIDRLGFPFCRGRILTSIETDYGQYDNPVNIFWASGTCMVVRSELFHNLKGFDNQFFAHMEEIDFCWRAQWAGYTIAVVPESKILHVGGGTLPNDSPHKLYLNYRNNLLMMYKNLRKSEAVPIIALRLIADHLSAIVYLFQGKWTFTGSVWKAHHHFWKMRRTVERTSAERTSAERTSAERTSAERTNKEGSRDFSGVIYRGSIVLRFFLSLKKVTFSKLRMHT